jgi:hypothetical protein
MTTPVAPKDRRPIARYMLVGILVLAAVAIILAWVDETGVGESFLRVLLGSNESIPLWHVMALSL